MSWNPDVYNRYKKERYAPFYDLLQLITAKPNLKVIDLGCGTGEMTRLLADALPDAEVMGIDSSKEMLSKSVEFEREGVCFELKGVNKQLQEDEHWDLIFSNAALQWVDNHEELLPQIISKLNKNGQIAIQVPSNNSHYTHQTLDHLAGEEPYLSALNGFKRLDPVLPISRYAEIIYQHSGTAINVFEKIYPHVLKDAHALFEWVSGTSMLQYIEKLPANLQTSFKQTYLQRLQAKYTGSPVFYGFKRTVIVATFE